MSTVNLAETLIHLKDRQPKDFEPLRDILLNGAIRFEAPDSGQTLVATEARLKFPVNLGDCFAYALARKETCPVMTLDKGLKS